MVQNVPPAPIRRGIADSQLYRYADGYWDKRGDDEVQARLFHLFPKGFEAAKIRNVRYLLRGIEPTMPALPPEQSKYMVNCLNGVVNVTGQRPSLGEHDPDHLFRYIVPHNYDPNASCPTIDAALAKMFPDPDMVTLIHEIFGYCLLPGFSLKKAILLYSRAPHTGKSSLLNMLGELVGHQNEATVSLQDLDDHKFARASLQDKLLNRSGDLGAYPPRSSSNFKSLVGGDPVLAEHKGQQQFSLINTAKLFFAGNSFAGTHESGAAYSTRWLVIPFTVVHETNPDFLRAVTTKREMEGLLKHAINGAARLVSNNAFTHPVAVAEAEYALQIETNSVARFVQECLTSDPASEMRGDPVYEDYKVWTKDAGLKALGRPKFYEQLNDMPGVSVTEGRRRMVRGLRADFPGAPTVDRWKANREHGI
jgi:putative DNA primase/helicase